MKIENILSDLNEEQARAVSHLEGPLLILAGAGSGKTRVITYRIAHMLSMGIDPSNILAVTFTNKAAREMKERIERLIDVVPSDLWVGTFHNICIRILKREIHRLGYSKDFSIYDTTDQQQLIKEIMRTIGIDEKLLKVRSVSYRISGLKNELINPSQFAAHHIASFADEKISEIYGLYQKQLEKNNAVDFDDIIALSIKLFRDHPDVLEKYQERCRYMLVDEYQDTNHAQYTLIQMLAHKYRNICVVGDPDQSIYHFRGADIKNILNFENDYPDLVTIKLEENYRSTKNILAGAQAVIERNSQRKEKTVWTSNEEGDCIKVVEVPSERDEGAYIAYQIRRILNEYPERTYDDCVIFYRTHAQSRAIEESLIRFSIPYRIVGGVGFYDRREIKDILAYLRIIQNPYDLVSLRRVINVPTRGIGEKTVDHVLADGSPLLGQEKAFEGLGPKAQGAVAQFLQIYTSLRQQSNKLVVSQLLDQLLLQIRYKEFILDGTKEAQARWENVRELLTVAARFDHLEPLESLGAFLDDVALVTSQDLADGATKAVSLMTLHSAKGLEFDFVFIVGVEENIFPSGQSASEPGEIEEERRLCYVGLTRARKKLFLLHAKNRVLYGSFQSNSRSRFIDELDPSTVVFEEQY